MTQNPTLRRRGRQVPREWRLPLLALAAGVAAYAASRLLPFVPLFATTPYGGGITAPLSRALSRLTGALPFSVAEVALAAYLLWIVALAARALYRLAHGRAGIRATAGGGARRAALHGGVALVAFYLIWGLNYARLPYAEQAGWPAWNGMPLPELVALAERATDETNRAYLALHGVPDSGAPTSLRDGAALEAAIDEGWRRAARALDLPPAAAASYGRVKWPRASGAVARFGISGVYSPFTGEAHVVRGLPATAVPVTMAHEKAHQRGVSREADANFLGFVAAAHAPDLLSRYSAALFAHRQLAFAAATRAPERFAALRDARLPGVQRDLEALRAYQLRHDGRIADLGTSLNDRFLSANGIDGGVEDYRRSVWLIAAYARSNGGVLLP